MRERTECSHDFDPNVRKSKKDSPIMKGKCWQNSKKWKRSSWIRLITILNVLLPTVDILTDLISITKLYTGIETHIDCDERSEVITYLGDFDDNSSLEIKTWYEGRRMCLANSSSEGLTFNIHPIWATSLLVPFLLNYLVTWFIWWSVDKGKTITWIAPLLCVFPQVKTHPSAFSHKDLYFRCKL